jgi:predicted methyltransferase
MDCSQAVLTLFLLVPCDPGGGHSGIAATPPSMDLTTAEALDSPERTKDDLVGDCFIFEGEISALRNSAGDHSQSVFAEGIRGRTDRVVCKFRPK